MKKNWAMIALLCCSVNLFAQINSARNLMPVPLKVNIEPGRFMIDQNFRLSIRGNFDKRIYAEASRFIRRMGEKTGFFYDTQGFVSLADTNTNDPLVINIKRAGRLRAGEQEGYSIEISTKQVNVIAETDLGALHGLETLMQLVSTDTSGYYFPCIRITDEPRFVWRGLLLDVALHFMPVDAVKRTLDGMAAVKLNVLHLHLSNDQGFRVESKIFPALHLKGSDGLYYTQQDIKEIIRYAAQRGIRIVPEFVVPGHTTAILTAFPELASVKKRYTLERYFGVFDPALDPTNPKVYEFLGKLYTEMAALFPDEYFHIGGDEVTGKDWENTPRIRNYMKARGMKSFRDLQAEFNKKLYPIIKSIGKKMVGWDEILHADIPESITIQSWRGRESFFESVKKGHPAILSHGYYIDLIQHADTHYLVDPIPDSVKLTPAERARVLGGEATMWSELVTPETVDSRIWPRLAPIAERFWSQSGVRNVSDMYRRMDIISLQLDGLGMRHISYRQPMMRRLVNGNDTKTLEVLLNVIEPLKIYERNSGDTMYTVFSPFTKLADAAIPDPNLPREFKELVDDYLDRKSTAIEKKLIAQLTEWKDNHNKFLVVINNSPVLKEAESLSKSLSEIASSGIEAVELLRNGSGSDITAWKDKQKKILLQARQPGGRCELQVVNAIEKLVLAAGSQNVNSMPAFNSTAQTILVK